PPPAMPTPAPGAPAAAGCSVEGRWLNTTPGVGESTITVARQPDGAVKATEAGMANFDGTVTAQGKTLHIDFKTTVGVNGWYEWTLDEACAGGSGRLVFTAGRQGEFASTVKRAP